MSNSPQHLASRFSLIAQRAAVLVRYALALATVSLVSTTQAFAAGGNEFGLNEDLQQFIDYATGPIAITIGTLVIIGSLIGAAVKSQRGERWGALVAPIIVVFLILNIEDIMTAFYTPGATM